MITELFSSNSLRTYNHAGPTLLEVVFIVLCAMISVLLMLAYNCWMKDDQKRCQVRTSVPSNIDDSASIDRVVTRTISDLRQFKSIKPFISYSIRPTTAKRIIIDLMDTAKETEHFSILPKFSTLKPDCISVQIALVQPSYTLLALIQYFDPTTMEYEFFQVLQQLFSVIFQSSNTIQTWGDLHKQISPFIRIGLLSNEQMKRPHFIDVQDRFRTWYNRIFPHHQQCHQRLDCDSTDGRLCSCSHRPCKSSTDRWSLILAIAYTFDEYLYNDTFTFTKCLAITNLAFVIEQNWTYEQVKEYIEQDHNAPQVNN
jgi:hypothetical protein